MNIRERNVMKKDYMFFKFTMFHSVATLLFSTIYAIYFITNVEHWNGTHDGATSLYLFVFFLICVVFAGLLLKKSARNNKRFVYTLIVLLCMFAVMLVVSYLYRCPYCYDGSFSKL